MLSQESLKQRAEESMNRLELSVGKTIRLVFRDQPKRAVFVGVGTDFSTGKMTFKFAYEGRIACVPSNYLRREENTGAYHAVGDELNLSPSWRN